MMTDCHSHILPEMDDGSDSIEMSCSMLELLRQQGVERSIATPHFYRHREKSVAAYLEKRQRQFAKLKAANPAVQNIFLGAEVAIEKGLSDTPDIEKLAIQGTDLILLELPYAPLFVVEAGTTSALGGIIGIGLGYLVSTIATKVLAVIMTDMPITVTPTAGSIAVAFGISVGIGVLFGYLPAKRAARLNPIEALRYD